jgi:hypothetical protein
MDSPGVRSASVPTTVTRRSSPRAASASDSGRSGVRRATVNPFSGFWYVIRSTTPRGSRTGRSDEGWSCVVPPGAVLGAWASAMQEVSDKDAVVGAYSAAMQEAECVSLI